MIYELFQKIFSQGDDDFFRAGTCAATIRRRRRYPVFVHVVQNVRNHHRPEHSVHRSRNFPTGRFRCVVPARRQGRTEDSAVDLFWGGHIVPRALGRLLPTDGKR